TNEAATSVASGARTQGLTWLSMSFRLADESQRRLVQVGERGGGAAETVPQEHDLVELHQGLAVEGGFVDRLGSGQQPGLLDEVRGRVGGVDVRDDLGVVIVRVVIGVAWRIGEPDRLERARRV